MKTQILTSAIIFLLFFALLMIVDFLPAIYQASNGAETVMIILVAYEFAVLGIPALLIVLTVVHIKTVIPVLDLEPPRANTKRNYMIGYNALLTAIVIFLFFSQENKELAINVFFGGSVLFLIIELDLIPIWGKFTLKNLILPATGLMISLFLSYMVIPEGLPIIRGLRSDIAAIDSGELMVGVLTISTEEMERGIEYREQGFIYAGHRWLYRFTRNPVRDEFSDTQNVWWPLYPPAYYPSVLWEMFPDSIHSQVRAYKFRVSIAPYSQIVVDLVPITDNLQLSIPHQF